MKRTRGGGDGSCAVGPPAKRTSTLDGNLTCETGVGVLVEARVQRLGEALKVHHGQGLAVLGPRRLDPGDADLDHDQPRRLDLVEGVPREVVRQVVVWREVVGEEVVVVEEADDLGEWNKCLLIMDDAGKRRWDLYVLPSAKFRSHHTDLPAPAP